MCVFTVCISLNVNMILYRQEIKISLCSEQNKMPHFKEKTAFLELLMQASAIDPPPHTRARTHLL